jgi:ABC-2 type transport system permease protein
VVLILAIVAMLLTALTVAREWERGSMEQLFATPVGRLEIVIGKQLPYLGLGIVAVLLVLAVGAWVFDLPFRGDLVLLAVDSLLFLMCMLGLGLLISVVTRSQMLATQVGALATILPNMLLSNFVFPVANMPKVLQWISAAMPASYFMRVLRGILLRGNGVEELWRESLALAGFALGFAALATLRFKRRIA